MKQPFAKKQILIAAVVAGAFATPAMADATIYGFVSAGVESAKATGSGTSEYKSRSRVTDQNSRIGFKGNEDLGNGLKAIWQVEQSLRNFEQKGTNDKGETATFATRNSFLGVESADFGKVLLGYYDTAYKSLTDVGLNAGSNTTADNAGSSSIYSRGESRLANSVHYFTPSFAGFKAGVSYGVDEARTENSSGRTNTQRLSVAGNYTLGTLQVGAGWERQYDKGDYKGATTSKGDDTDFYKLAASYKFPTGTLIGAGYEWGRFDSTTGGSTLKQNDWTVMVSQEFGAAAVKLSYSELGGLKNAASGAEDDYKAKQWVLAGTYDLSKRTQLYAYATKIDNNKSQNVNFGINPVYDSGLGTSSAALTKGNDPQAFGIGMKHTF
ncbi:porin [Pseudogulbenkiania sp. MAI-1]|uniref:porin n=1 Tax=Pseudogulbenkiania sp. MAI-1 TaxID=990370 RepID=UPI00045E9138|nr:porin [Pseudogulbenkiania sp. MAI-1]